MIDSTDVYIDTQVLKTELLEARKSKKLTQAQVAEKAGISLPTVTRIESGKDKGVTLDSIMRYLRAIDYSLFIKNRGGNSE